MLEAIELLAEGAATQCEVLGPTLLGIIEHLLHLNRDRLTIMDADTNMNTINDRLGVGKNAVDVVRQAIQVLLRPKLSGK